MFSWNVVIAIFIKCFFLQFYFGLLLSFVFSLSLPLTIIIMNISLNFVQCRKVFLIITLDFEYNTNCDKVHVWPQALNELCITPIWPFPRSPKKKRSRKYMTVEDPLVLIYSYRIVRFFIKYIHSVEKVMGKNFYLQYRKT